MKALHYAYPTSQFAKDLNYHNGCWYITEHDIKTQAFDNKDKLKALKVFEAIDMPIDTYESFTRNDEVFKQ